jgi:hypothetical protein
MMAHNGAQWRSMMLNGDALNGAMSTKQNYQTFLQR